MPSGIAPRGLDDAYRIQEVFAALKARACGPVVGRKIALTTPQMRALVGLGEPIAGCLHERQTIAGPAQVRAGDYGRLLIEFEIAFRLDSGLAAGAAPFDRAQVAAAVGAVMPAFEIADDRGADYATLPARGLELAADNAWNEGAVLGAPVEDWRGVDLAKLRGVAYRDETAVGEGQGADTLGHPLEALRWLANHLAARGLGLRAGDLVISGSLVTSRFPAPGERWRFEAGALGGVELQVD